MYITPAILVAILVACCWLGMFCMDLGRARGWSLGDGGVGHSKVGSASFRFVARVLQA